MAMAHDATTDLVMTLSDYTQFPCALGGLFFIGQKLKLTVLKHLLNELCRPVFHA